MYAFTVSAQNLNVFSFSLPFTVFSQLLILFTLAGYLFFFSLHANVWNMFGLFVRHKLQFIIKLAELKQWLRFENTDKEIN